MEKVCETCKLARALGGFSWWCDSHHSYIAPGHEPCDRYGERTNAPGIVGYTTREVPRNIVRNAQGQIIGQNWDTSYGGLSPGDIIEEERR